MLGVLVVIGDVIIFLDLYCEVNVNWFFFLFDCIVWNCKIIVCLMIDVIDYDDFWYEIQVGDVMWGVFDWEMYYKWILIFLELQKVDFSDLFEFFVMVGGLFVVDWKWFWEFGGYDLGLEIWGGEQYEIFFKVWMCGGCMEDIFCFRVGYIYRKYVFYKVLVGVSLVWNFKWVVEVWMDEYVEYIYQCWFEYCYFFVGDVVVQKKFCSFFNCKSFKWFMMKIVWDLFKFYLFVEFLVVVWGEI